MIKTYSSRVYPFLNICLQVIIFSHANYFNQSTNINPAVDTMSQDIANSHSRIQTISYMSHLLVFHNFKQLRLMYIGVRVHKQTQKIKQHKCLY